MKRFLVILVLLSSAQFTKAQSTCDITSKYGEFIVARKLDYNGRSFLVSEAVAVPEGHCLSPLIKDNLTYINYLITNFSSKAEQEQILAAGDSVEIQKTFISYLQRDSTFNNVMSQLTEGVESKEAKPAYSTDDILNIAIKYFSISGIREGNYVGKVCAGINDIKSTERYREPQLEAFCFSAILNEIRHRDNQLMKEFMSGVRQLYTINLGVKEDERLLRAQGALFLTMRNNPVLKEVLQEAYASKKEQLPFTWADE